MHTQLRKQKTAARVQVVTLGCSKNSVDSEHILAQLQASGVEAVAAEPGEQLAPVVVLNTCGFIDRAKQESIDAILHYTALKQQGQVQQVVVAGCLSARYAPELQQELPEVDAFFGSTHQPQALLQHLGAQYRTNLLGERALSTPGHFAYLKISEGCNRTCGFCAIPLMRGRHVSRPVEELVAEAKALVARGVRELMLIAQELTFYGHDLYGRRSLHRLLEALAGVEGLAWIRLHYAYPAGFPLEVLDAMAAHSNICRYLDMPLQHASDPVLQRMRRGISRAKMEALLDDVRRRLPGVAIRTTFLVGYPGETPADVDSLLQFVEQQRFQRVGVFQYSHEEGTHAHQWPDDVPPREKQRRHDRVMDLQAGISLEHNRQRVGQTLPVLLDRQEGPLWVGRTEWDSPEVDNEVHVSSPTPLQVGQFVEVRITDATEYDLMGEAAGPGRERP